MSVLRKIAASSVLFSLCVFLSSAQAALTLEERKEAMDSFDRADTDRNKQITVEELQAELYRYGEDYDKEEVEVLAGPYDLNSSGTLNSSEYLALFEDANE